MDKLQSVELSLDQCIKCNICTTACPVAGVSDQFPGPKYAAPQAQRYRSNNQSSPDISVDFCSGCRVCNMVCPTGVKIAEINARARAAIVAQNKIPFTRRLRNNLIARAEMLGKLAQPIAPAANALLSFRPARLIAQKTLGIHHSAPFPPISKEKFTDWFADHQPEKDFQHKVVYFHGCSTQYYEPRIGKAAVQVLEANNCQVLIPKQNCCGLPLLSNGEFKAARKYHQKNVNNLVNYAKQGYAIIGTSTSCTLTLKEEAPELLDMLDPDTTLVAQQTFDYNEFLLMLFHDGKLNRNLKPIPLSLPYHIPCQYRAHRLGRPGFDILSLIPDLNLYESHVACCGIAGTYGYKEEKYDIAMQVGEPLFDLVRKSGAPVVVCDSETCRWQITHATGIPAVHPVELLAASYGFEIEGPLANIIT